jgi:hypothetical protein
MGCVPNSEIRRMRREINVSLNRFKGLNFKTINPYEHSRNISYASSLISFLKGTTLRPKKLNSLIDLTKARILNVYNRVI